MKTASARLPILLIGTAGIEIKQVARLRPNAVGYLHETHAWSRLDCSCGEVHASCDRAYLSVLVGRPQASVHIDPDACGLVISPEDHPWRAAGLCEVLGPSLDFNLWAAHVVRHVVGGVSEPGLLGFDFQDLVDVLTPARSLRFARQSSPDGLVSAAAKLVEENEWISSDVHAATVGLWGDAGTTLAEISAVGELLERKLSAASLFAYAPIESGVPAISILGA
jgi:hypothetical protein